jgi:hypothetical protein
MSRQTPTQRPPDIDGAEEQERQATPARQAVQSAVKQFGRELVKPFRCHRRQSGRSMQHRTNCLA